MRRPAARWHRAVAEHEHVVAECLAVLRRLDVARWHVARLPGAWSAAEELVHVTLAYELGATAAASDTDGMRLRVPTARAALSRALLPLAFALGRFPRGGVAPAELRPDPRETRALTPHALAARLGRAASVAVAALQTAATRGQRRGVVHPYFGALDPLATLRLLSAHTRHHTRHIARRPEDLGG